MTDRGMLAGRLAETVARMRADRPLTWRACHAVKDMLGTDGASMTIENSSVHRVTLCATDVRSELLENLQDVLGEGPCRDAYDTGRANETPLDGSLATHWPQFIPAAEKIIGSAGVLWSLPMRSAGDVIGTISLYRLSRGALTVAIDAAQLLADAVAGILLKDPLAFTADAGSADAGGWSSRSLVHQATGMLAGQLRISPADALAILRSYAFATGDLLGDVARSVVERKLNLSGP